MVRCPPIFSCSVTETDPGRAGQLLAGELEGSAREHESGLSSRTRREGGGLYVRNLAVRQTDTETSPRPGSSDKAPPRAWGPGQGPRSSQFSPHRGLIVQPREKGPVGDTPRELERAAPRWASAWSRCARWDPKTLGDSGGARAT